MSTTYASKNSAERGARRQKLENFTVEQDEAGRWIIVVKRTRQRISTTDSPVAFIWHWLGQDDNAKLSRAEAIAALTALGCAAGTVSTQRQRFLRASDIERKARASRATPAPHNAPVAKDSQE